MPEPFDVSVLGQDESSEIHQLLTRFPDIEPRRYQDGEHLVREGEEDQDLFIVVKGAFTVEHPPAVPEGRPVIIASTMCGPGNVAIVGEMAYFGTQCRTASIRSSGATYTLCLKPAHIDAIMDDFPMLTRVICQQFTTRLKEANDALLVFQNKFALEAGKRMAASGEVLFSKGEPARVLHQLLVGSVQLEKDGKVTTVTPEALFMGFLEPEAFLKNQSHRATATVQADSFLATIDIAHKETLLRCFPQLAMHVLEA